MGSWAWIKGNGITYLDKLMDNSPGQVMDNFPAPGCHQSSLRDAWTGQARPTTNSHPHPQYRLGNNLANPRARNKGKKVNKGK